MKGTAGSPTRGDPDGDGVAIVLNCSEQCLRQGEGPQGEKHGNTAVPEGTSGHAVPRSPPGKPDASKGACPVWEGAGGNVPQGNALAAYFT